MQRLLGSLVILFVGCGTDTVPDPPPPTPAGPVTLDDLARGGDCAAPTGPGTDHQGSVTADETWTAAGSPHRVPARLQIMATVTVEACAVVRIAPAVSIEVSGGGKLVTRGIADLDGVRPVVVEPLGDAGWGQLLAYEDGQLDLAITTVRGGGAPPGGEPAAVALRGVAGGTNTGPLTRSLRVDRVLIDASHGRGLDLDGWAAFADGARGLWIRGAQQEALRAEPGIAATLPTELVVAGNGVDAIVLRTNKAFTRDDTLVARGVPYHVRGPLYLNSGVDGTPATLTIEPGVTVGFAPLAGSGLIVGATAARLGQLVAVGREDAPIVLQSAQATPAAGDWSGLVFRNYPTTGSRISYARILHAGANNGANGFGCGPGDRGDSSVLVQGQGPDGVGPDEAFIDHTHFDEQAGDSVIVSGWYSDTGPNLSATNTFGSGTPACKVSRPQRTGGGNTCDEGREVCWP